MDTMSSGRRYKAHQRPILPLDTVSAVPTPVVIHELIPRSMENNTINDLYGKTLHTFNCHNVIKTCDEEQQKVHLRSILIEIAIFSSFLDGHVLRRSFSKEIK